MTSNTRRNLLKASALTALGTAVAGSFAPPAVAADTPPATTSNKTVVNIEDFKTPSNTYSEAFAAAVTDFKARKVNRYASATIWYPEGTYDIQDTVINTPYVSVGGVGTIYAGRFIVDHLETGGNHASISGLLFLGPGKSIILRKATDLRITDNIFMSGTETISIEPQGLIPVNAARMVTISGNVFLDCDYAVKGSDPLKTGEDGDAQTRAASDIYFTNNILNRVRVAAVSMDYVDGITVLNNTFFTNIVDRLPDGDVRVPAYDEIIIIRTGQQVNISGNNFWGSGGYAIRLGAPDSQGIDNAMVTNNNFWMPGQVKPGGAMKVYARLKPNKSSLTFTGNTTTGYSKSVVHIASGILETVTFAGNMTNYNTGNSYLPEALRPAAGKIFRYEIDPAVKIRVLNEEPAQNRVNERDSYASSYGGRKTSIVVKANVNTNSVIKLVKLAAENLNSPDFTGALMVTVTRSDITPVAVLLSVSKVGAAQYCITVNNTAPTQPVTKKEPIYTWGLSTDGWITIQRDPRLYSYTYNFNFVSLNGVNFITD